MPHHRRRAKGSALTPLTCRNPYLWIPPTTKYPQHRTLPPLPPHHPHPHPPRRPLLTAIAWKSPSKAETEISASEGRLSLSSMSQRSSTPRRRLHSGRTYAAFHIWKEWLPMEWTQFSLGFEAHLYYRTHNMSWTTIPTFLLITRYLFFFLVTYLYYWHHVDCPNGIEAFIKSTQTNKVERVERTRLLLPTVTSFLASVCLARVFLNRYV